MSLLEILDNSELVMNVKPQTLAGLLLVVEVAMQDRIQVQAAEVVAMILDMVEMVVLV